VKVVIIRDLKGVGRAGDIVEVPDGYGRNFLIPKSYAKFADSTTVQEISRKKAEEKSALESQKKADEKLSKILGKIELIFSLPATPEGSLYSGLKESEILAKIKNREPRLSPQAKLADYQPIKKTGDHSVILLINLKSRIEIKIIINSKNAQK